MKKIFRKINRISRKLFTDTKKAFTIIELLIVISVIGILFIVIIPRIDFVGDKARETGVKTDFRAFSLAAEQLLRENAGLSNHSDLTTLCDVNDGINLYLDPSLEFNTSGISVAQDPWNQNYTIQLAKPTSGNPNNGCIIFLSNGKDSVLSDDQDNYAIVTVFVDGKIETETIGFSSNIETDLITNILGDDDASMSISSGTVSIDYKR